MMSAPIDLHEIRREHGGMVYDCGRRWVGPGPGHSRHDQSLSVCLSDDGRPLVHSFSGDPFLACVTYLGIEKADVSEADQRTLARMRRAREVAARQREAADLALCQDIWFGADAIEGTPAETYLYRRGLIIEGCDALRFHHAAPRTKNAELGTPPHPAMVAITSDPLGKPRGLHLTFLTPSGEKAFGDRSRLMFGPMAGSAVRLEPIRGGALGIGEGIETSAAFGMLKGVSTWAALSTSGLQNFNVPLGVRRLLIAADSDDGGAGLRAANALAEKAKRLCDVEIHPAPEGQDWADVAVAHG